jgi:dihydroceramide fatty acyl 2-hydroxylase
MLPPVSSPQRIRLFKSERLEKLTLISPRTFALSWGILLPVIAWAGWGSADPLRALGLVAAGLFAWTLFEYAMHRYLFHLDSTIPVVRWMVFLIHGNHHADPGDPLRGLMPLPVSVSVGLLVWVGCEAALGMAGTWAFLGFMTGYVIYDSVHFACHQFPMRGRLGAALKRHHMRHHHIDQNGNYAISAIVWDRVFRSRITSLKRRA